MAADRADIPLMRELLKLKADPLLPNADNTTPLMAAAGLGTANPLEEAGTEAEALEAVQMLLELDSRQERRLDLHLDQAEQLRPLDRLVHPERWSAGRPHRAIGVGPWLGSLDPNRGWLVPLRSFDPCHRSKRSAGFHAGLRGAACHRP